MAESKRRRASVDLPSDYYGMNKLLKSLKCPDCHNKYRASDRKSGKHVSSKLEPILLSCGHGACEHCVGNSGYSCTICKKVTEDGQQLSKHFYILGMMTDERNEKMKLGLQLNWKTPPQKVTTKKNINPDLCEECQKIKATVNCKICTSQLCQQCFKNIHSPRIMQSHKPEPLDSPTTPSQEIPTCPLHPDSTCSLLCNTCSVSKRVFFCRLCHLLGAHQQHEVTEMANLTTYYKHDIEKLMGDLVDVIDALHFSKERKLP